MRMVKGVIVEATRDELHTYWLRCGFDDFISFSDFLEAMINLDVKVREEESE